LAQTRILLVDIPGVLAEIITAAFSRDSEFVFVSEGSTEPIDVVAAIDREGAGFVILWSNRPEPPEVFLSLLRARPRTKMLALANDGRENLLYLPLGELSPDQLADSVRSAATRGRRVVAAASAGGSRTSSATRKEPPCR
jgi:hypothetical protein